jgi:HK97 family phage portal protein
MGLVIETDAILSSKIKERQEKEWQQKYNPKKSSGRPVILDGGMKAKTLATSSLQDSAFNDSVSEKEKKVAVALGVPPLLLDSGNNANIKPNLELFFYTTVLPMLRKMESSLEWFFAVDLELSTHKVPALKPDVKEQTERVTGLVNNGIITGNEGRAILRLAPINEEVMNKIRIPANVAGSATGVEGQEGGAPSKE